MGTWKGFAKFFGFIRQLESEPLIEGTKVCLDTVRILLGPAIMVILLVFGPLHGIHLKNYNKISYLE